MEKPSLKVALVELLKVKTLITLAVTGGAEAVPGED